MTGFIFDLTEIEAVLADWMQLESDLVADAEIAQPLTEVAEPGNEPASRKMVNLATFSGEAFLIHNSQVQDRVRAYIDKLTDARNKYLTCDEAVRNTYVTGQR